MDEDFGRTLKRQREQKKLSQEKLADLVTAAGHNITGAYISMLERSYDRTQRGTPTRPNKDFILLAAPLLDWDINEALELADYAPLSKGTRNEGFFKKIEKLSPTNQQIVRKQIEALIEVLAEQEHDFDYIDDEEKKEKLPS